MTNGDYASKFAELNALLNDPAQPFVPGRVWELMDAVMGQPVGIPQPEADSAAAPA